MAEQPRGTHGPGDSVQVDDDADVMDLRASLDDLAGLVTEGLDLKEVLRRVATFAVTAVPGADGAGVTLLRPRGDGNEVEAVAASHAFVAEIDRIQYVTLNEGPCITAALERRTVRSGSLGGDDRGPGSARGSAGSACTACCPFRCCFPRRSSERSTCTPDKDAFDDRAASLGERSPAGRGRRP